MKNKLQKFGMIAILMFIIGAGLSLSACETMEGAGQDLENAGESVQDAAN